MLNSALAELVDYTARLLGVDTTLTAGQPSAAHQRFTRDAHSRVEKWL